MKIYDGQAVRKSPPYRKKASINVHAFPSERSINAVHIANKRRPAWCVRGFIAAAINWRRSLASGKSPKRSHSARIHMQLYKLFRSLPRLCINALESLVLLARLSEIESSEAPLTHSLPPTLPHSLAPTLPHSLTHSLSLSLYSYIHIYRHLAWRTRGRAKPSLGKHYVQDAFQIESQSTDLESNNACICVPARWS
jgi:hypothetical protein